MIFSTSMAKVSTVSPLPGREEGGSEMPYGEPISEFAKRGFPVIQSGLLKDIAHFHYFDTGAATSTTFEIYSLKGQDLPEPNEGFPGPPAGLRAKNYHFSIANAALSG